MKGSIKIFQTWLNFKQNFVFVKTNFKKSLDKSKLNFFVNLNNFCQMNKNQFSDFIGKKIFSFHLYLKLLPIIWISISHISETEKEKIDFKIANQVKLSGLWKVYSLEHEHTFNKHVTICFWFVSLKIIFEMCWSSLSVVK